jgi:hypothetical protein
MKNTFATLGLQDHPHCHIIYDHPAAWIGSFCIIVREIA